MCKFMGQELLENSPVARESEEAGITQFLTHKSTLISINIPFLERAESIRQNTFKDNTFLKFDTSIITDLI